MSDFISELPTLGHPLLDWGSVYELAARHSPARDLVGSGLGRLAAAAARPDGTARDAGGLMLRFVVEQLPGVLSASVWRGQKGLWTALASSLTTLEPELYQRLDWLSEVLDREHPDLDFPWGAVALLGSTRRDHLLVYQWSTAAAAEAFWPRVREWSAAVECLWAWNEAALGAQDQARHLQGLLDLTAAWNRATDSAGLLQQIAETSTTWIPCERATIFLWDRANRVLLGRPALGVDGGELRVPDDAGLVGQVVQTGLPGRVDADVPVEQAQVDRRTDMRLNFHTRSLLCVPLWGDDGQCVGAFELINKQQGNFDSRDLGHLVLLAKQAAIALSGLRRVEQLVLSQRTSAAQAAASVQLRGSSPLMTTLRESLTRVAPTDLSVLLLGENGTGKEVAARLLHYESRRRDEVLVAVNCAAIPDTLLESELFGHEKGAFTDAIESRPGKFELASQGTIFLDEIGDMSLSGQAKLLRVLEDKTIVRVGGSRTIATQARVVAATNQNLAELVRQRRFREDLFFRLNVVTLEIPPLRLRGNDVIELAMFFLDGFCQQARRTLPRLTEAAQTALRQHPWPGNVRELRNMMERLAFLSTTAVVEPRDLSFLSLPGNADSPSELLPLNLPLADATRAFQIKLIQHHLDLAAGNVTEVANRLGVARTNLYRKMKQLGMSDP